MVAHKILPVIDKQFKVNFDFLIIHEVSYLGISEDLDAELIKEVKSISSSVEHRKLNDLVETPLGYCAKNQKVVDVFMEHMEEAKERAEKVNRRLPIKCSGRFETNFFAIPVDFRTMPEYTKSGLYDRMFRSIAKKLQLLEVSVRSGIIKSTIGRIERMHNLNTICVDRDIAHALEAAAEEAKSATRQIGAEKRKGADEAQVGDSLDLPKIEAARELFPLTTKVVLYAQS